MLRRHCLLGLVFLTALFLAACSSAPVSEVVIHTQEVTVVVTVVVPATGLPTSVVEELHEEETNLPAPSRILSGDARDHVGESVQVRVERAWCSYQPGINGAPTFCNDARYPGHAFTFLVWGQDWSDLDGRCVLVEGKVEMYDGLPQIETVDRTQVRVCDP